MIKKKTVCNGIINVFHSFQFYNLLLIQVVEDKHAHLNITR